MKPLPLLFAFAFSGLVLAQDSPAPAPAPSPAELPPLPDADPAEDPGELMRNQPGGRLRPAPQAEPSLLPQGIPGIRSGDRPKNRSTLRPPATSAELDARIRFRQAHSRASNEPMIKALWQESREVPTDGQKRDALRRYYTALYKRILSFDKGIAPLVEERQRISLRRLDQTRIDPTDPLEEENRQRRD